jgi:hypothetical protein
MVAAIDCESHRGNGGGCEPLKAVLHDVEELRGRVDRQDEQYGHTLQAAGEARTAAGQAKVAAHEARDAAVASKKASFESRDLTVEARDAAVQSMAAIRKIEEKIFGPVNETIAKYSSPPPPDFGDVGEDSKVQDWATIYKRAKSAEKEREDLQKGKQDSDRELKAAKAKFYIALAGFLVLLTVVGTAIARMKGLLP